MAASAATRVGPSSASSAAASAAAAATAALTAAADTNISLVEYYRARLERVERDFQEALAKIDSLKISHRDHHALAWQVHRREAEVAEIQQALSDAQVQVFDERKQLLKVIAENDELKIQELKDRKKIRYLLSMTGNPEPEVTYFRDRLNKRLVKIGTEDRNKAHQEIVAGLQRDRQTLLEEENIRRGHEAKKMESLLEKNDSLRQLNRENVRELLLLKKSLHQNERRLVEEKTRLTNEILQLKSQYAQEKERVEQVEKVVEAKLTQKHADVAADLRIKLQKSEEDLRIHKKKLEAAEKGSKKKAQALDSRIQLLTKNYNSLKRRRDYEIEGFTNDILMLRKQLKMLEKSILKYGPLEDRELVLLNLARETGHRAAQISSDLQNLKNKVLSTEQDLRSLVI
ncbi:Coiled-coil domain-containing protein 77 [Entophlyctis luteolus]|nr:Coiled-coil domain-containing protein 77 [Entophlyctis luteolus]